MDPSDGMTRLGMAGGSEGIAGTVIGIGGGLDGMVSAMAGMGLGLLGSIAILFRSGAAAGGAVAWVFGVTSLIEGALTGAFDEAVGGADSTEASSCNQKRTPETMEATVMKNTMTRLRVRMNQST